MGLRNYFLKQKSSKNEIEKITKTHEDELKTLTSKFEELVNYNNELEFQMENNEKKWIQKNKEILEENRRNEKDFNEIVKIKTIKNN